MSDTSALERPYLTTPQAEEMSGLSRNYLARLLREGVLEGQRIGRDWIIFRDSLDQFLATSRKPGPKGPRKHVPADDVSVPDKRGNRRKE
jgi:excisionase family DNA binding protein